MHSKGCGKGYWDNPQFLIKIPNRSQKEEKVETIISLMQSDQVKRRHEFGGNFKETNLPIAFSLYKPLNQQIKLKKYSPEELEKVFVNRNYVGKKEVIERFLLTTGFYVIIPSTYESNENLNFIIRVFIKIMS